MGLSSKRNPALLIDSSITWNKPGGSAIYAVGFHSWTPPPYPCQGPPLVRKIQGEQRIIEQKTRYGAKASYTINMASSRTLSWGMKINKWGTYRGKEEKNIPYACPPCPPCPPVFLHYSEGSCFHPGTQKRILLVYQMTREGLPTKLYGSAMSGISGKILQRHIAYPKTNRILQKWRFRNNPPWLWNKNSGIWPHLIPRYRVVLWPILQNPPQRAFGSLWKQFRPNSTPPHS